MRVTLISKGAVAELDTLGAQLVSYQDVVNTEYLWQGDPAYWKGQAPILFPIVGALRNERAVIGGKAYSMAQHGFARHREFTPVITRNEMAVFSLKADEVTKRQYPFDFDLRVTYRLEDTRLTVEFLVTNLSDRPMPFVVGGHPAFRVPVSGEDRFENWVVEFEKEEVIDCPKFLPGSKLLDFSQTKRILDHERKLKLTHGLFYDDALICENTNSRQVKLYSILTGRGVEMEYGDFRYLGIWSAKNDAPFVALEPWTGCGTAQDEDDCFERKRGMKLLEPELSFKAAFTMNIL